MLSAVEKIIEQVSEVTIEDIIYDRTKTNWSI